MSAVVLPAADPVHEVRQAMLAELAACKGLDAALLRLRLRCAGDPAALWHLRVALMQAMAAEHGEGRARRSLAQVDGIFRGRWPGAPVTRAAPLR
jgi:hypothetical protein